MTEGNLTISSFRSLQSKRKTSKSRSSWNSCQPSSLSSACTTGIFLSRMHALMFSFRSAGVLGTSFLETLTLRLWEAKYASLLATEYWNFKTRLTCLGIYFMETLTFRLWKVKYASLLATEYWIFQSTDLMWKSVNWPLYSDAIFLGSYISKNK